MCEYVRSKCVTSEYVRSEKSECVSECMSSECESM